MNCRDAQERILESFDAKLRAAEFRDEDKSGLAKHLAGCQECTRFAALQSQLDLQLQEQITSPLLSPHFRAAVLAKAAGQEHDLSADWLPDAAYFASSAAGLALSVVLLPFAASTILMTGALVVGGAYLLQTFVSSVLQQQIE